MQHLLIEGYTPDELLDALVPDLAAEVLSGRPLIARVGTADILLALRLDNDVLTAEIAHVDGGGEGALPTLFGLIKRLAESQDVRIVRWHILAARCARPNPRLRPILERCGFALAEPPSFGLCFQREDILRADTPSP
jgi:hypothetical protein